MPCFKCKHDGTVICNAEEAEIRCLVCGRCGAEATQAHFMEEVHETRKWPKWPVPNWRAPK